MEYYKNGRINEFFPWFLQNLIWLPTQIVLRIFARFKVYGRDNFSALKGGVIFASNHTSEIDPILLPASLPLFSDFLPMFYVSREKKFYDIERFIDKFFYGGTFFGLWGAYQTHVGLNNYELSLKSHIKILENGHSVCIFPEGRKSVDGLIHEGKGGVAFLSHKTGAPIIPVFISGTFKISPIDLFLFRNRFSVKFGRPIYPEELFDGKDLVDYHEYKVITNKLIMSRISEVAVENSYQ